MFHREQLDMLDLIIQALLEHERRMSVLVCSLEALIRTLAKIKGISDDEISEMIADCAPFR